MLAALLVPPNGIFEMKLKKYFKSMVRAKEKPPVEVLPVGFQVDTSQHDINPLVIVWLTWLEFADFAYIKLGGGGIGSENRRTKI